LAIARNELPQDSARDKSNCVIASCNFGDIWTAPGKNDQSGPAPDCGTVVLEPDLRLRFFAICNPLDLPALQVYRLGLPISSDILLARL
jgi:hypothetical protein